MLSKTSSRPTKFFISKLGREAFDPNINPMSVQPYRHGSRAFECNFPTWLEGWKEAEKEYNDKQKKTNYKYEQTHQQGNFIIEQGTDIISSKDCDFGIQIAKDGRVWICINGVSFVRFVPHR